jgi:hypothetical protein
MSVTEILNRDRARRNQKHAERNRKRRQKSAAEQPGVDPEQLQQQDQQQHDEREQQRQEAEATPLPRFVRYRHLQDAGIIDSWQTLCRLIDEHGFPPGIFLSPNVRAWNVDEVERWLAGRPSQRKPVPSRWHRDSEQETSTEAI